MILVPPGSAKSTVVSVCAPAWMWITRPAWRGIFASGNPSVSTRDSQRCRAIVESEWYRENFAIRWTIAEAQNLKLHFATTATGYRLAVSAQTRITGERADGLFVDDALDAADAYSKTARESTNDWYDAAFANRLNDLRTGTRVMIQQRLHVEDLAGHVLAREADQWEVLRIPMVWEESQRITTSLGWSDPRLADGELMFPERFPAEVVAVERLRLGESGFAGQHQQRPFAAGGEVFKDSALRLLDSLPPISEVIIALDTAFKVKETNDYSVACVLGRFDRGTVLLDVVRGRYAYPQLLETVARLAQKWSPSAVLIEDAASGMSLVQDLQQNSALPVMPIRPDGDKLSRAHVVVPSWEAGLIYAPTGAPWIAEFLEELTAFPRSAHDDQVDAFVMGVRYLSSQMGVIELYTRLAAPTLLPLYASALPAPPSEATADQAPQSEQQIAATLLRPTTRPLPPREHICGTPPPIPPGVKEITAEERARVIRQLRALR
jgi:predicted phage terminase large subunit-like protein